MTRLAAASIPAVFVLVWATGFVVARLVAPHAEPLTFLSIRFALAAIVLAAIAVARGAAFPRGLTGWGRPAVAGLLLQALYLGPVFWAVAHGLPAAISALVAGTQPLLTACLSQALVGERLSGRRWAGIGLGTIGVALVILPRLGQAGEIPLLPLAVAFGGTLAITAGTFWQKRQGGGDLAVDAAIQFAAAAPVVFAWALLTEDLRVDPAPAFWIGLAWSVLGISIGAIALLLTMIRLGAVAGIASLFFMVPPVTAVMSLALFGDTLAPVQLIGMAAAAAGLLLATRPDGRSLSG